MFPYFDEAQGDAYVGGFVADPEEYLSLESASKKRYCNIASRTLTSKYRGYVIPADAVYDFASLLATTFSDQNKLAQQGVTQFSLSGSVGISFKNGKQELADLVPRHIADLISDANPDLPKVGGRIKPTVL